MVIESGKVALIDNLQIMIAHQKEIFYKIPKAGFEVEDIDILPVMIALLTTERFFVKFTKLVLMLIESG